MSKFIFNSGLKNAQTIFSIIFLFALLALTVCGQTKTDADIRPLTVEQPIERELKGDEAHSYSLTLQAGQFLNVVVEQKGIDVIVMLFDTEGKKLAEADSPNGMQGAEPLTLIVETAGNYRLEVRSAEKTVAPGRYEVKIMELRTGTEKDKNRVAAYKIFGEAETLFQQATAESLSAAIEKFDVAKVLFHEVGDKNPEAVAVGYIGLINNKLGRKTLALESYQQALALVREVGNKDDEAATLNNIALVYSQLGDSRTALKYLQEILPIVRQLGDKMGEATTLNNIGGIENLLDDKQSALKSHNAALLIRREINDKAGEAMTLNNIGITLIDTGELRKSIEYLNNALALRRAIGDKTGEGTTLNNLGAVYLKLNEYELAVNSTYESLPLTKLAGNTDNEARSLKNLMSLWTLRNNPRFAVFWGKQTISAYQKLRANAQGLSKNLQQSYLKSIEEDYRYLANILLIQERLPEAQQVLNSFKDQQFFDANPKQFNALKFTTRELKLLNDYNKKVERIGEVIKQRATLRRAIGNRQPIAAEIAQLKQIDTDLQRANDDYAAFLKIAEQQFAALPEETDKLPTIDDLTQMQTALRETSASTKQKTVAVYTLISEDNYRALVVTPDDVFSILTPIKGADLNRKAQQFWRVLRTPTYNPKPLAKEIYDAVFAPLAAKLPKDTKTILWSLDGNLRYVPMAALFDGKKYLVERYQNVLFTRADRERLTRDVAENLSGTGFGSSEEHIVELSGEKFNAAALPAVKIELSRIFKSNNPRRGVLPGDVLLDAGFTKQAMISALQKRRPLVHIASHFKFEPGDEARSFLLLGDGTPFTLDEMKRQQDLFGGVDLLTLSACQTAAQRADANGREVDGFAELAQRLGAVAVMASLWEVSDNSTAELMSRFYRNYKTGADINKAAALRQAQLALLRGDYKTVTSANRQLTREEDKDTAAKIKIEAAKLKIYRPNRNTPFAHPYYWSPFILFGNWK